LRYIIGQLESLIAIHRAIIINTGTSIINKIKDKIISNVLFAILHHAVIDMGDNSIMGTHHIQFSHDELIGVCFDIFGYIIDIPYILASENI
jgi:hypothetical protein